MPSAGTAIPDPAARDRDVLLVFPGRYKAPDPQVPLQLLHVAGALQRAGYRPGIFDMRLHDYHGLRMGDPVFVGITAMSGPQIRYGLEFARWVRAAMPRRVFTLSQVKYAIDRLAWLYENRELVGGLVFTEEPEILRFFYGRLAPVSDWQDKLVAKFRQDFGDSL